MMFSVPGPVVLQDREMVIGSRVDETLQEMPEPVGLPVMFPLQLDCENSGTSMKTSPIARKTIPTASMLILKSNNSH